MFMFVYCSADHRDLHVLTHSFPTRRSSGLRGKVALAIVAAAGDGVVQQRAIDRARGLITIDFTAELLERALQMRGIGVEIETPRRTVDVIAQTGKDRKRVV